MARREIKARDIVLDIRAGMDNDGLMHKYRLSPRGLQNLLDELAYLGYIDESEHREVTPAKRRISAQELADDIRAGLPVAALREKYGLSRNGLRKAYKKLAETGFLKREEVPADLDSKKVGVFKNLRKFERYFLDFDLPIIDANDPEHEGKVRDITETGVGVIGIPSKVDETKTFLIMDKRFFLINPLLFEAQCKWVRRSESTGDFVAGYRITNTPEDDKRQLRKLVRIVRLVT